jgi:serpin B
MTTPVRVPWIVAATISLSAACAADRQRQPGQASSNLSRDLAPQVAPADAGALVAANTAFAAALFQAVRTPGNVMISPYGVSLALAMTWAGAAGDTASAMAQALRFELPPDRLHPAFDALDLALAARGQGAQGKDGQPFRLAIANAAWGQEGFDFVPAYLDTLAVDYGAGISLVDFAGAPESARAIINDWVAARTEDRVKDLLGPGSISPLTRLVLTNAVYFNARWMRTFQETATQDAPFMLADGSTVSVPTMHAAEIAGGYAETADWIAAELPYDGGETSMVVVLPRIGSLDTFEAGLDGAALQDIAARLGPSSLKVSMPRFGFESRADLKQALTALGMGVAFSGQADFTGICAGGGLAISDVLHQTFVAVDEDGTEAAAATAVVVGATAAPAESVEVKIDRPFLFFIRDVQTGTVLFLGHVTDPRH